MTVDSIAANRARVDKLIAKGVAIAAPDSVVIGEEVALDNIEAGVVIGPATTITGADTMIGAGTSIQGSAVIKSSQIGRASALPVPKEVL